MNQRMRQADPQNALLHDLESIRMLLDEDCVQDNGAPEPHDFEVPVLEDVVATDPIPAADADCESQAASATEPATERGLDDDLFRALLSDEWRESSNEILRQAREVIGAHRTHWSPAETDVLNDALKVRIDATIQGWMRGMVVTHMADLHDKLLNALSAELKTAIEAIIDQRSGTSDGQ